MSLRSLLRKEVHWSKHNVIALVFLLVLLPSFFAYTSVAFETVIPRDAPVAVVPANDDVTEDDLTILEGVLVQFSDPRVVESEDRAREILRRESVYAIVEVPPNITDGTNRTPRSASSSTGAWSRSKNLRGQFGTSWRSS